jgi:hypothetical protein
MASVDRKKSEKKKKKIYFIGRKAALKKVTQS